MDFSSTKYAVRFGSYTGQARLYIVNKASFKSCNISEEVTKTFFFVWYSEEEHGFKFHSVLC